MKTKLLLTGKAKDVFETLAKLAKVDKEYRKEKEKSWTRN